MKGALCTLGETKLVLVTEIQIEDKTMSVAVTATHFLEIGALPQIVSPGVSFFNA